MIRKLLAMMMLPVSCLSVWAQEPALDDTTQATPARPFGLSLVGPVQIAASDTRSTAFQSGILPTMSNFVTQYMPEGVPSLVNPPGAVSIDPSMLIMSTAHDARVYFVSENAAYHNSLGFNTQGGGVTSGNPLLIFPDASMPASGGRTTSTPLKPGDFVDLGRLSAGTQLNFFLVSDGARGGTDVYSTDPTVAADGLAGHTITYAFAFPGTSYYLVGFEDTYGMGDQDHNDTIFAIDVGRLVPTPAETTLTAVCGLVLASYLMWRRRTAAMSVA